MIKACIFDLDGVIVDTAKYHFIAWRNMAASLGIEFTHKHNEQLKGVGRMESLEYILSLGEIYLTQNEKVKLTVTKNDEYIKLISNLDSEEMLTGVNEFIRDLKQNDVKIALGSSSKNASTILKKLKIDHYFEAQIDGTKTTKTKPDPQVFEMGAKALNIAPSKIVVFEDAIKGVQAAKAGGFNVIGIGDSEELQTADHVLQGFQAFTFQKLQNLYQSS